MLFGFALIAFINSYFLEAVFKKYIPKDEREDNGELRPLFEDEDTGSFGQIGTENSVWSTSSSSKKDRDELINNRGEEKEENQPPAEG